MSEPTVSVHLHLPHHPDQNVALANYSPATEVLCTLPASVEVNITYEQKAPKNARGKRSRAEKCPLNEKCRKTKTIERTKPKNLKRSNEESRKTNKRSRKIVSNSKEVLRRGIEEQTDAAANVADDIMVKTEKW